MANRVHVIHQICRLILWKRAKANSLLSVMKLDSDKILLIYFQKFLLVLGMIRLNSFRRVYPVGK
ncbi:hypothetical protein gpAD87_10290 [Paenibacillus sp. AD87]|nr:hypothetical protein gpAD87_10290 [Paenibacillus sp. AD87]